MALGTLGSNLAPGFRQGESSPKATIIRERIAGLLSPVANKVRRKRIGDGADAPVAIPRCLSEGYLAIQLHSTSADRDAGNLGGLAGPDGVVHRVPEARWLSTLNASARISNFTPRSGHRGKDLTESSIHYRNAGSGDDIAAEVTVGVLRRHRERRKVVVLVEAGFRRCQ